ncbi:hypothetical protein CYMTET_3237 [Cymbomonas tetramitiformis]|uniref:Uncharacterized protein n=1 Tax=Cymbomonas tetramitiformis TaxID=36881 RepID=A0AAE0LL83_9CHLO|nr:hypothetical protein CYMTET_3237 [Cymbomonas tetramitiformis]
MPEGKYGSWTPAKEGPEKINFTKFLTLFHHYPDLRYLTTADGQRAIPMATLGKTKPNTVTSEAWAKVRGGMLALYPYICEAVPPDHTKPGDFWESAANRKLKQQYRDMGKVGHLDRHTKNTEELKQVKDWPGEIWERHQAGQPLHKILKDLSPYPLARNPANFAATEIQWTAEERRQIGLPEQADEEQMETGVERPSKGRQQEEGKRERWAEYEDPMEMDMDLGCIHRKGALPKAILAVRTFQIEPGNRETIVEQYRTIWNTDEETWSTAETIVQYIRDAGRGEREAEQELKTLIERNEEIQKDLWEPQKGKRERLAGRPRNTHKHWPKITNLQVHTSTINPDEDIVVPGSQNETGERHCQVRVQNGQAYSYEGCSTGGNAGNTWALLKTSWQRY